MGSSVPKIIHFIWAGGKKPLPERDIKVIQEWQDKNPDFQIWLWIDKATTSSQVFKNYKQECPWITLKDITEEKMVDEFIRYEIDRLIPNYGASSDLLRYKILYQFGGAYFDTDVISGKKSLNQLECFNPNFTEEFLLIDPNSQNSEIPGNDTFICSPQHPIIGKMVEISHENYRKAFPSKGNVTYEYEEYNYFKDSTVMRTGPYVVCEAFYHFKKLGKYKNSSSSLEIFINGEMVVRQVPSEYHLPPEYLDKSYENTNSWLGSNGQLFIQSRDSEDEAIDSAVQSALFEIQHIGLLRLDDHIKNIVRSLKEDTTEGGMPNEKEEYISRKFISCLTSSLKNIELLANVKHLQTISRFAEIRDFYLQYSDFITKNNEYIGFNLILLEFLTDNMPKEQCQAVINLFIELEFKVHLSRQIKIATRCAHYLGENIQELRNMIEDEKDFIKHFQKALKEITHSTSQNEVVRELEENLKNLNNLQIATKNSLSQSIKLSQNPYHIFQHAKEDVEENNTSKISYNKAT